MVSLWVYSSSDYIESSLRSCIDCITMDVSTVNLKDYDVIIISNYSISVSDLADAYKSACIIFIHIIDTTHSCLDMGDYYYASSKDSYKKLISRYGQNYVDYCPTFRSFKPIDSDISRVILCNNTYEMIDCIYSTVLFILIGKSHINIPDYLSRLIIDSPHTNQTIQGTREYINKNKDQLKDSLVEFKNILDFIQISKLEDIRELVKYKYKRLQPPKFISKKIKQDIQNKFLDRINRMCRHKSKLAKIKIIESEYNEFLNYISGDPSIHLNSKFTIHALKKSIGDAIQEYYDNYIPLQNNIINYSDWHHLVYARNDIIFDTDVIKTFTKNFEFYSRKGVIPYKSDWIGIITGKIPLNTIDKITCILGTCKGLIVYSQFSKITIQKDTGFINTMIHVVPPYIPMNDIVFQWSLFELNTDKKLLYITDNAESIILPDNSELELSISQTIDDFQIFDNLLLVDSTTLDLEIILYTCIAHNIPVLAKQSHLTIEILGVDYPLLYTSIFNLAIILDNPPRLYQGYSHLVNLDKHKFTKDYFISNINELIGA